MTNNETNLSINTYKVFLNSIKKTKQQETSSQRG